MAAVVGTVIVVVDPADAPGWRSATDRLPITWSDASTVEFVDQ